VSYDSVRGAKSRPADATSLYNYQGTFRLSLCSLCSNPSMGLVVGLFVGFFQKTRASITAAACLLPQFLFRLYANGWAGWSDERLPPLLAHQFLVFVPAIVVAHYVWAFKNRRATAA
jgi:hypothetical protein